MKSQPQEQYYPNWIGYVFMQALEEVIGQRGVNAVLNLAAMPEWIGNYPPQNDEKRVPYDSFARVLITLENFYGPRGGHGVAIRTGRACFPYGLRYLGLKLGLTELAFRVLPFDEKLLQSGRAVAEWFSINTEHKIHLERQENKLLVQIENCSLCWGRKSNEPVCHLATGLLQEALYWVSSGKNFNVEETHCIAFGDPTCTIEVDLNAMS